MSFAYMPLFTGDYLRDTRHLSMSEHGAFLLLLAHCWDQKGPAPLDERKLMGICNARSTDEIEAMRRVLQEFFIQMDDGWYNKRMQTEIERSESISHQRSEAGKRGFQARAKQLSSKSQAIAKQVHLSPSPSPSLSPPPSSPQNQPVVSAPKKRHTGTPSTFQAEAYLCEKGLDKKLVREWLAVRKRKRLHDTETAMKGFEREAIASGIGMEKALRRCVENSWGGFKARWLEEESK